MNDINIGDEIQIVLLKDGEDKTAVCGWYLGKEIVDIEEDDSDEIIDKIETPKLVLQDESTVYGYECFWWKDVTPRVSAEDMRENAFVLMFHVYVQLHRHIDDPDNIETYHEYCGTFIGCCTLLGMTTEVAVMICSKMMKDHDKTAYTDKRENPQRFNNRGNVCIHREQRTSFWGDV